jgi:hypothetical protein
LGTGPGDNHRLYISSSCWGTPIEAKFCLETTPQGELETKSPSTFILIAIGYLCPSFGRSWSFLTIYAILLTMRRLAKEKISVLGFKPVGKCPSGNLGT